jgi:O-antigen/teichoic acid export membrane protein
MLIFANPATIEKTAPPETRPIEHRGLLHKLLPWAQKGGFAVIDQGLVSGSNFFISVLLARWMSPEQYGAFALVFAIFLLLSTLYQCLLLEPMAVFGGSMYRHQLRGYVASLLWIHLFVSGAIFLLLGGSGLASLWAGGSAFLPGAFLGMGVAAPCILLFWLARRGFYLEMLPGHAALGGMLYCLALLAGLGLAYASRLLSPLSVLLVIGVAALVASAFLFARLRSRLGRTSGAPALPETWQRHWIYGRWALAGAVASWIPAYIYFPLLSSLFGLARAGELKALMNIAAPLTQLQAAFSMLLLPYAARVQSQRKNAGASGMSAKLTLAALAAGVLYWAAILPFKGSVFQLLYSGKYTEVVDLLPIVAVGSVLWAGTFGSSTVLRAIASPRLIFVAYSASAVVSVLVGIPAMHFFGLRGAIWGINLSDGLSFVALSILLRRTARNFSLSTS